MEQVVLSLPYPVVIHWGPWCPWPSHGPTFAWKHLLKGQHLMFIHV